MWEIDILGDNRFETYTKTRVACRAIVRKADQILVSREEAVDCWLLPGGGLEAGETLRECCIREVLEETGYLVEPVEEYLVIHEYYEEYRYTTHFYICEITGEGQRHLTEFEKTRGLVPMWVDISFFDGIVSDYQAYAVTNEERRGAYQREHTAITAYLAHCAPKADKFKAAGGDGSYDQ